MICKPCSDAARDGTEHSSCVDLVQAASGVPDAYEPVGHAGRWCDCQHEPVKR